MLFAVILVGLLMCGFFKDPAASLVCAALVLAATAGLLLYCWGVYATAPVVRHWYMASLAKPLPSHWYSWPWGWPGVKVVEWFSDPYPSVSALFGPDNPSARYYGLPSAIMYLIKAMVAVFINLLVALLPVRVLTTFMNSIRYLRRAVPLHPAA